MSDGKRMHQNMNLFSLVPKLPPLIIFFFRHENLKNPGKNHLKKTLRNMLGIISALFHRPLSIKETVVMEPNLTSWALKLFFS